MRWHFDLSRSGLVNEWHWMAFDHDASPLNLVPKPLPTLAGGENLLGFFASNWAIFPPLI